VVQAESRPWPRGELPRLAGVSSFGVGGTNAHVVLEEAPALAAPPPATGPQLLRLSARTPVALERATAALATHLEAHPQTDMADAAHTLAVGRRDFAHRTFVTAATPQEAARLLRSDDGAKARARAVPAAEPGVVFVFPGQGAQYAGMGRALYGWHPAFTEALDACFEALAGHIGFDLRALLFGDDAAPLAQTAVTQPATFCIEYALARTWLASGVEPVAMVGHSVGEFVAAVLGGVMSLADGIRLVARRGALLQALPAGAMLGVRQAAAELEAALVPQVQLAADNGPQACVLAGPAAAIDALVVTLDARGVIARKLQTSHAFHSAMMEPAVAPFRAAVQGVALAAPNRRIVSTVTAQWLGQGEATSPDYWAAHLRRPVRFAPAIRQVLAEVSAPLFLEVGPRATLSALVRQHRAGGAVPAAIASLADAPERETRSLCDAAGQLWAAGAPIRWSATPAHGRRRIVLPAYPFERQRHWVDAAPSNGLSAAAAAAGAATASPTAPSAASPAAGAVVPALPAPPLHETSLSLSHKRSDESVMTVATAAAPEADRRPALIERLRTLLEDVSGADLAGVDPAAAFVEAGLDSLTLTQVALQLKREFGMNITFRQLMEGQRSLATLAAFLDDKLPRDAAAPAAAAVVGAAAAHASAPAAAALPTAVSLPAGAALTWPSAPGAAGEPSSLVQQVIQQQMVLMAQQLALLQGRPDAMAAPPAAAAAAVASPVALPATSSLPAAAAPVPAPSAAAATDEEAALAHRSYDVKKAFGAIARIHTAGTEISERQRARLAAFMRRYIQKTERSKAYTVQHRPHLADPRVVNGFRPQIKEIIYQLVIERSKGSHLWDLDGNEYVDALNGFGMSLFGWQPDFVLEAVRKQLDGGYDIGPQHPLAGPVARLVCELTGFERAGLCNTGSEAVMGCMRIARTVTGRSRIAIFAGAYHGIFDEVIVRGTKKLKAVPAAPGIMSSAAENVVVLDYGTPESLQWLKANAGDLAAVLVEPVQSRRPDFQPREFLRDLRALTERAGALLIFDEVVTGFRSHPGGAQALFGIRADLASYGKVIGGGFPIGVIAGKREYMDALDGGHWEYGDESVPTVGVTYFAGTFVRHPLALAAAHAVLEHLKREGPELQTALTRRTAAMVDELNAFCRQAGAPITLKSFASVWKVFFDEDHPLQDLLFAMMRNRGVHILDNFPCFMTTAHTVQDIAVIKTAFKEAVAELQESEFLPRPAVVAAQAFDATRPPVAGARLGRDASGNPAWFVANPEAPGKYIKVEAQ
ncbi:MAG: aminotransferase class III-fold pyridoxal phosphate-dependent enzyme, partial [Rubrivivax sp.]|nr:aminotransferase class III-fold pyridoxal phosphate-dependent enzyme [Rubrivivax sp.]